MSVQQITVLGATGSVGVSTLDVIARHPDRYRVFALTANQRVDELAVLCRRFVPAHAVLGSAADAARLRELLAGLPVEISHGQQALADVASADPVDAVMAAIVGAAGLAPTLAAARRGKRILLANKESLVMAGELFMAACREAGAVVLPIDSEHNAVFQCLPPAAQSRQAALAAGGVRRILLTASGGPFRRLTLDQMRAVSPDDACAHPNWRMGRKISVDSATMMNKGLEVIEAHHLFGLPSHCLEVVVHPQSVIHSLVEYLDGSMLAQLGNPDMRTPIAHALAYPERVDSGVAPLDLFRVAQLDFEPPDTRRFPSLRLAREALEAGGGAACVLNAANEIAVAAFLDRRIGFTQIADVVEHVMQSLAGAPGCASIDAAIALDAEARSLAGQGVVARAA
ncbi:MAG: 1-deoxy-D-xylulose-5-phosphate reductoisomerase [Burkholderiaceae bacterium]|jgi:1-deoxy-D-xylulose-5-phosphate reductoisomerase|nr:1-deoxy-D-xylulose-5-phosphate reductoisomerase [Burkholderiaceae bacterium]MBP7658597.1 1-deoxy-D-xylulose-5-phosphate reductoisomerase [Burkholderiaceae bacterium]